MEIVLKFAPIFLTLFAPATSDVANDKDAIRNCFPEIQQYLYCLKQEVRYHKHIIGVEISKNYRTKVDACLTKFGCQSPSTEPRIEQRLVGTDLEIWVRFRSWIEALPTPKRQCLLHSIGDTYREVFVRCLRQSAPGLTIPPLADTVGLPQDVLLLLNERAYLRTMIADSFRDCNQTDKAAACVLGLRRTEFPQACTIRKHCAVIDDDAGFNDCFTTCLTLSSTCKDILNKLRSQVCSCQMEKRREHLKVDQARPDKSMLFDQKAKEIAAALLYEMAPQEKKSNTLVAKVSGCGIPLPVFKSPAPVSNKLARYIWLYVDGYASRDITYCHNCPGQEI